MLDSSGIGISSEVLLRIEDFDFWKETDAFLSSKEEEPYKSSAYLIA